MNKIIMMIFFLLINEKIINESYCNEFKFECKVEVVNK